MSTARIWQTVSTSSADTERLGQLVGQNLRGSEVLELRADLGGGKTTFTRGLAAGLKSDDRVSSPTFTLSRVYKAGELSIHHYDFYRLDDPGVVGDQLAESVGYPQAVTVVEWADVVDNVLPEERLIIEFTPTASSADERQITITYTNKYAELIEVIENGWQGSRP